MRLTGRTVRIVSDNDNYSEYINKDLIITSASNKGYFYDDALYPQKLCDLKVKGTNLEVPFALYEYEFEIVLPEKKPLAQ